MTNTNKCSSKKKSIAAKPSNFLKKNSIETDFICYLKFYLRGLIDFRDRKTLERIRTNGTYLSAELSSEKIQSLDLEIARINEQIEILSRFKKHR